MKRLILFACLSVFVIAGCDEAKEYNYDRYFYMGVKSLDLYFGDEHEIKVSPGSVRNDIVWTSQDAEVATVSKEGVITATGVGSTNIVASLGDDRTLLPVTVTIPTVDNVVIAGADGQCWIAVQTLSERIKTARIFWNNDMDSVDVEIGNKIGVFPQTIDYAGENGYIFRIVSIDKFDNKSQTSETTAIIIQNREIASAPTMGDGKVTINWRSNLLYVVNSMLLYTNFDGEEVSIEIPNTATTTIITDYASDMRTYTLFSIIPPLTDTFQIATMTSFEPSPAFNGPHTFSSKTPCEIAARDFDFGGEGVAYNDVSNSFPNSSYRTDAGDYLSGKVEIEGGGNLGWTDRGEWLVYTVEVQDAGVYAADVSLSVNNGGGGAFSISLDDNTSETTVAPNNSSWNEWCWVFEKYTDLQPAQPTFRLTAGQHKFRFSFESGGFNLMGYKFTYISD